MPLMLMKPIALSPFGRAQGLDPHANQSFTLVFIRPYAECDVPRRRWNFIARAVEIDSATMPAALAQSK
jgi:hypothetical protein